MPFKVEKVKGGFKVKDMIGKAFSKKPLYKRVAQAQRIAIALSEAKRTGKPPSVFFK